MGKRQMPVAIHRHKKVFLLPLGLRPRRIVSFFSTAFLKTLFLFTPFSWWEKKREGPMRRGAIKRAAKRLGRRGAGPQRDVSCGFFYLPSRARAPRDFYVGACDQDRPHRRAEKKGARRRGRQRSAEGRTDKAHTHDRGCAVAAGLVRAARRYTRPPPSKGSPTSRARGQPRTRAHTHQRPAQQGAHGRTADSGTAASSAAEVPRVRAEARQSRHVDAMASRVGVVVGRRPPLGRCDTDGRHCAGAPSDRRTRLGGCQWAPCLFLFLRIIFLSFLFF